MNYSTNSESTDSSSKCRVCAKPIPAGAQKCTECDEYQSWYLRVVAGLDLGGLIALVPIATLAFVFIQDRIVGEYSDLDIALVSCAQDSVTVFVSNTGNRSGIISKASYTVLDETVRPLVMPEPPAGRLFEGGDSRVLKFMVDMKASPGGLVPFEARRAPDCKVKITFETVNFDHVIIPRPISCGC